MTTKKAAPPIAGKGTATEKSYNPFETAQAQFDRIANLLGLDAPTRDLLRNPIREYHFSFPCAWIAEAFRYSAVQSAAQ